MQPFWKKLLITFGSMLCTSFIAGLLWRSTFNSEIPSYLGGVVGGVSAVFVWEILRRIGPPVR